MAASRWIAVCLGLVGCGLERDWAAWQAASASAGEASSGSSSEPAAETSTGGPDVDMGDAVASTSAGSGDASTSSETGTSAGSEASEAGDTSTGATAVCGDGVVDAGEECDDGNTDETDRCTSTCLKIRLVFVTSEYFQGNINGLMNADATCRSLASKAKTADPTSRLEAPFLFKALLPISTQTVFERHYHGAGPYQLVNGLRVSDSFEQLFAEPLQNPINVDERSQSQHNPVWTGMLPGGASFPGVNFCHDWAKDGPLKDGSASWGDPDAVDDWWLYVDVAIDNPTTDCADSMAFYCLEQE